jgi:hypothetical protein
MTPTFTRKSHEEKKGGGTFDYTHTEGAQAIVLSECDAVPSTEVNRSIASHRIASPRQGTAKIWGNQDPRQDRRQTDLGGQEGEKKAIKNREGNTHTHSRAHTPHTLKHNLATRPHGHLLNQAPSRFTTSIQPRHPPKPCISASSASMPNRRVGVPLPAQLVEPKTIPAKAALGSSRHFGPVCSSLPLDCEYSSTGRRMDGWVDGRTHARKGEAVGVRGQAKTR